MSHYKNIYTFKKYIGENTALQWGTVCAACIVVYNIRCAPSDLFAPMSNVTIYIVYFLP